MPPHSLFLASTLVAVLSASSLAGNVTFGKVYHSGEFVYNDRDLHAIVSPTQARFRRSPCPAQTTTSDYYDYGPDTVRFSFNVSPKTISKADCKHARTNKTTGQWFQGSDRLMTFYRTAAAELGVMSAVFRKPPTYGLTIDTKTDPSKAVLTINDVKEGTSDAYVFCNETTTTSTTSTTTTTTMRSTTTSSPSTTASTSVPSSTTTITSSTPSTAPETSQTPTAVPSTLTTRSPPSVSTSDPHKKLTTLVPSTTSDGRKQKPLDQISQEILAQYDQVTQAKQQANAAFKKVLSDLRSQGRNAGANALEKEFANCDCGC